MNRKRNGFSLVELMIAMVISLTLSLGLFTMFRMSATNVENTSALNSLQDNGRVALTLLANDIKQAGFLGDMTGVPLIAGDSATLNDPVASDCSAGDESGSYPVAGANAFRMLYSYRFAGEEELGCLNDVVAGTDVIQIKRVIGPPINDASRAQRPNYLATTANEAIFVKGQRAVATPNVRFWRYIHHVYFIKNRSGTPTLMRRVLTNSSMASDGFREQNLVENVEAMRFLFGVDYNGDSSADVFLPNANLQQNVWNQQGATSIVAVQIFLLLRTEGEDNSFTNDLVYQFSPTGDEVIDNAEQLGPYNDGFRRKVMSTTVVIENSSID